MYKKLNDFILDLDISNITEDRKKVLEPLVGYIQGKVTDAENINLNFICTHNSRRSHLSQIWAQTMAYYFQINNTYCYSGGTEATALFPMVATTLQRVGFQIETISNESNPVYQIKFAENTHPVIGFSKTYDSSFNPTSQFAAILTCSSADQGCPFIAGAEKRIPLTFEDPKMFDNSPLQVAKYLEKSIEIATEIKYVFSKINNK